MGTASQGTLAPRVLVIMNAQWPRALLRAALRDAGYDALGARNLVEALEYPTLVPGRGPVRLVIVDQRVLPSGEEELLMRLLHRHNDSPALLLAQTTQGGAEGPWRRVIRRPASIGDIVEAVRTLLPLPAQGSHS